MNANVETHENPAMNYAKLAGAVLILVAGIVGFYYFGDAPQAWRMLGLIAAIAAALALGAFTAQGRQVREFMSESQFELRKVVWPTMQETTQTTLVVLAVVLVLSIILWIIDLVLWKVVSEWLLSAGS